MGRRIFFGCKIHSGADQELEISHSVKLTPAKLDEIKVAARG